jgi:hypothetical protein
VRLKVLRVLSAGGGLWRQSVLDVECSRLEGARLSRLADVFHPELHVTSVGVREARDVAAADRCRARLRVWYPPANRERLASLLEERMAEVIPGLDIAIAQEAI